MADEKEFVIIVKAKDLVKHTFKMATAKRFPNKYRFTIANRVCDLVLDIFQHVQEANELDISDPQEFRERQYDQKPIPRKRMAEREAKSENRRRKLFLRLPRKPRRSAQHAFGGRKTDKE